MLKTLITEEPIRADAKMFVTQEGDAIATYSREFYRTVDEPEQPVPLLYGLHAIAAPVYK